MPKPPTDTSDSHPPERTVKTRELLGTIRVRELSGNPVCELTYKRDRIPTLQEIHTLIGKPRENYRLFHQGETLDNTQFNALLSTTGLEIIEVTCITSNPLENVWDNLKVVFDSAKQHHVDTHLLVKISNDQLITIVSIRNNYQVGSCRESMTGQNIGILQHRAFTCSYTFGELSSSHNLTGSCEQITSRFAMTCPNFNLCVDRTATGLNPTILLQMFDLSTLEFPGLHAFLEQLFNFTI